MRILGIETSCDETGAAIIEGDKNSEKVKLLTNFVSSSLSLHAKTGGIIPEVAARKQVEYIIPVIKNCLQKIDIKNIDAIGVTIGPGLIGSLLVGVETAKTLAYIFDKPIIPVNHLFGHMYANWIVNENINLSKISFPAISLIVSGGHTDLVLINNHREITWLGGTRDDAAGEAFDKIGRVLELPYPGGPEIEKASKNGDFKRFSLPKPLIDSDDFDFSFSGLKTATAREIIKLKEQQNGMLTKKDIDDICASLHKTITDILILKTIKAVQKHNVKSVLLGGGVAANQNLRREFEEKIKNLNLDVKLFIPSKNLCTDNAAMIATAAFYNYEPISWQKITANPELYFD